jgi:hypothetical protein
MKFNKANKNLLSEMDMASTAGMRKYDKMVGNNDDARIRIMKMMGADQEHVARWKAAERKGISFEAFLMGLVDELKNDPDAQERGRAEAEKSNMKQWDKYYDIDEE